MIRPTVRLASVAATLAAACVLTVAAAALASAQPSGSDDILPHRFAADSGRCPLGATAGTLSFESPTTVRIQGTVVDRGGVPTGLCDGDRLKTVATFVGLSDGERVDFFRHEVDNGRIAFRDVLSTADQPRLRPIDTVRIQVCLHSRDREPAVILCGTPVDISART